MANRPVSRKRVHAFRHTGPAPRRAPDGSAFLKCEECGVSVAVVLMDMHTCKENNNNNKKKKDVKRFKADVLVEPPPIPPINNNNNKIKEDTIISEQEQPRSPFMFFMESYSKTCEGGRTLIEINREAVEKWKTMSSTEQWPFVLQAHKVDNAYSKLLRQEEIQSSQGTDDGADSAKLHNTWMELDDYYSD